MNSHSRDNNGGTNFEIGSQYGSIKSLLEKSREEVGKLDYSSPYFTGSRNDSHFHKRNGSNATTTTKNNNKDLHTIFENH